MKMHINYNGQKFFKLLQILNLLSLANYYNRSYDTKASKDQISSSFTLVSIIIFYHAFYLDESNHSSFPHHYTLLRLKLSI